MDNAKRQAVDLAKQTIEDLKGMAAAGAKAAVKETGNQFVYQIIIAVVILIIFGLARTCSNNSSITPTPIIKESFVKPDTLKVNVTDKATAFENYSVKNIGFISIPKIMEIQSGNYKKLQAKFDSVWGRKYGYQIDDNRIVFQQKGLNNKSKKAFNTYARIMIETTVGKTGDYQKLTDSVNLTSTGLKELDNSFKQEINQSFQGTELHLLEWKGTKLVVINGRPAIKLSYSRQLGQNQPVQVDIYTFQNNDRMHRLTFSYRLEDSKEYEALFSESLISFKITNLN